MDEFTVKCTDEQGAKLVQYNNQKVTVKGKDAVLSASLSVSLKEGEKYNVRIDFHHPETLERVPDEIQQIIDKLT